MKVSLLILGLSLMSSFVFAKEISVNWSCADRAATIQVFYDSQNKIQFQPDIFSGSLRPQGGVDYSSCIGNFQRQIDAGVTRFREEECPSSQDTFCYASNNYTNGKVIEKLQQSAFLQTNRNVKVSALNSALAAKIAGLADSPEAYLEGQIAERKIDPKNLSQTFNYQNKAYKISDFDKVVGENIENVFSDLGREEAKQYAQNYMAAKSEYLRNNSNPAKRKEVLDNVNKMFGYIYGDKSSDELAKILECEPEDNLTPITQILQRATQSNLVSKCKPLAPGEHKLFSQDSRDYYGTGSYLLRRDPNGNYQAVLNVKFKLGSGSVSPSAMMARAKGCLDQASPYMKGPNGEKLQMTVMTEDEVNSLPVNQRPRQREISIEGPNYATNAGQYVDNVDCPTITHEMLHLLGLCDEYRENRSLYAGMWECRVVTQATSIMRETTQTYRKVMGGSEVCDCSSSTCKGIASSGNEPLKKLFTTAGIHELTDYQWRSKYCYDAPLPAPTRTLDLNTEKPYRLSYNQGDTFKIERLYIYNPALPPYYKVAKSQTVCRCPAGDQECLRGKEKLLRDIQNPPTASQCPAYSTHKRSDYGKTQTVVGTPEMVIVSKKDTGLSLLQPNHFKKILAGNCPGIVDGYLECAENAYKSLKDGPCNAPARCRDDSYYLGAPR